MTRVFVDTYFLLALVSRRDEAHEWAKTTAMLPNVEWVTSHWVLTEFANGMAAAFHRSIVARLIAALQRNSRVQIVPADAEQFEKALRLYGARADKDWSLTDCSSFVLMQELGITQALTADRHFEQAGFTLFKP